MPGIELPLVGALGGDHGATRSPSVATNPIPGRWLRAGISFYSIEESRVGAAIGRRSGMDPGALWGRFPIYLRSGGNHHDLGGGPRPAKPSRLPHRSGRTAWSARHSHRITPCARAVRL